MNSHTDTIAITDEPEKAVTGDDNPLEPSCSLDVKDVIDTFLHKILDIEDCAKEHITSSVTSYNDNARKLKGDAEKHLASLKQEKDETARVLTVKSLRKTIREIERHNRASPFTTLGKVRTSIPRTKNENFSHLISMGYQ